MRLLDPIQCGEQADLPVKFRRPLTDVVDQEFLAEITTEYVGTDAVEDLEGTLCWKASRNGIHAYGVSEGEAILTLVLKVRGVSLDWMMNTK